MLFFAVAAIFAITVMGNLDGTLRQTVLPNGISGSITDIASPFTSSDEAKHLLGTWEQASGENTRIKQRVLARPGDVAAAWILIDSVVLAPFLATLLILISRRRVTTLGPRLIVLPVTNLLMPAVPGIACLYLVSDLFENLFTAGELYWSWQHKYTRWLSGFKLAFFSGAVLALALSFAEAGGNLANRGDRPLLPKIVRLRVPVAGVAGMTTIMLLLPGSVRPQLVDVVRTLTVQDDWAALLFAFGGTVMLSAAIWASGVIALESRLGVRTWLVMCYALIGRWAITVILLGLSLLARFAGVFQPTLWVVFSMAAFLTCSSQLWGAEPAPLADRRVDDRRMLATLTAAPFVVLAVAILRSADLVGSWTGRADAALPMAILVGTAAIVWRCIDRDREAPVAKARFVFAVLLVVTVVLGVVIGSWPVASGWLFGSVAILLVAVTLICVILSVLERLTWWTPAGVFTALRVGRLPIVTMVILAVVIVGEFDSEVDFHRARLEPSVAAQTEDGDKPRIGSTVDDLAMAANAANGPLGVAVSGAQPVKVRPLIVIAASGGGGRAAYWTSLVANCLFAGVSPDAMSPLDWCKGTAGWSQVAVASGISGGSVGLAMFDAVQLGTDDGECAPRPMQSSPVDLADVFEDEGFLDPAVASLIFRDAVFNVWRRSSFEDRAAVLEQAFEEKVPQMSCGFFETQTSMQLPKTPVLFLNSASVQDGCRINISVLDGSNDDPAQGKVLPSCVASAPTTDGETTTLAATRDIVDFVCLGQDLNLSTAALLSARFPYVSPSGALTSCVGEANLFAVDGGFIDSSAASTTFDLIDRLVHAMEENNPFVCVQPVVIQIDNSYVAGTASLSLSRTPELLAPIVALGSSSGLGADRARESLALASRPRCRPPGKRGPKEDVNRPEVVTYDVDTYVHLYPELRPGIEAPLGWSLSEKARDDLHLQLGSMHNAESLCAARSWLDGSWNDTQACTRTQVISYEARDRHGLGVSWELLRWLVTAGSLLGLPIFWLLIRPWLLDSSVTDFERQPSQRASLR